MGKPPVRVVDVRLGVVQYGGVTMAIYMYSQNLEIFRLLQAAYFFDQQCEALLALKKRNSEDRFEFDPFPDQSTTAAVYYELLCAVRETYQIQLQITLDALSGSSAGGINAIGLATAVAKGEDLEGLRSTWLEGADADKLKFQGKRRVERSLSLAGLAGGFAGGVFSGVNTSWRFLRSFFVDKSNSFQFPPDFLPYVFECYSAGSAVFDGTAFENILANALSKMGKMPLGRGRVHRGKVTFTREMRLFTTATNLDPEVYSLLLPDSPGAADMNHANHLTFSPRDNGFDNRELLVFAARATSAFPFGFPGTRPWDILPVRQGRDVSPEDEELLRNAFKLRHMPEQNFSSAEFVDGGLTNNKPFEPMLAWMQRRRHISGSLVDRRLLFLEPHPKVYQDIQFNDPPSLVSFDDPDLAETKYVAGMVARRGEKLKDKDEFEAKVARVAAGSRVGPVVYEWMHQGYRVIDAMSGESIREEIQEINALNAKREYEGLKQLKFLHPVFQSGLTQPGSSSDALALIKTGAERSEYFECNAEWDGLSEEEQAKYNYERGYDAVQAFAELLARPSWLKISKDTMEWQELLEVVRNFVFRKAKSDFDFGQMINQNIWWLRDALVFATKLISDTCYIGADESNDESSFSDTKLHDRLKGIKLCTTTVYDLDFFLTELSEPQGILNNGDEDLVKQTKQLREMKENLVAEFASRVDGPRNAAVGLEKVLNNMEKVANRVGNILLCNLLAELEASVPEVSNEINKWLKYFPTHDLKTFSALSPPMGEYTPFCLRRLSPDDSSVLFGKERQQLARKGLSSADVLLRCSDAMHFAGFFDRAYRANDQIWGHLDGVESMCRLICDVVDTQTKRERFAREELGLPVFSRKAKPAWKVLEVEKMVSAASIKVLKRDVETIEPPEIQKRFWARVADILSRGGGQRSRI